MYRKVLWGAGFAALALAVIALAIFGGSRLLGSHATGAAACKQTGPQHVATIKDNAVHPGTVTGKRCDTLKIVNADAITREIGFGNHDHHQPYDGVAERLLRQGESLTITLNQTGDYHFHDHFHDEVAANFIVQP